MKAKIVKKTNYLKSKWLIQSQFLIISILYNSASYLLNHIEM